MAGSPLNRKLKNFVIANSSDWLEQAPAVLGDLNGVVATGVNGMVYARFTNGQVVTAFNRIAPLIRDLQVIVGRSKTLSNTWQVILVRENYLTPASNGAVADHHSQHEFPSQDTVWIDRKQMTALTILVSDADNFLIQVFGALVRTKNGIVMIDNTELDVSTYLPASGAVYVAVESDEDGVLSLHEGDNIPTLDAATVADVPTPGPGKYTIGFVALREGLTELSNDLIGIPYPLVTDYDGIDTGYTIHAADADTPLDADEWGFWDIVDDVLKKITWANVKALLKTYFDTLYLPGSATYKQYTYETNTPNKVMSIPQITVDGALAVVAGVGTWIALEAGVLESITIYCANNGSSGSTIVDCNKNGVTVFTTSGNRPEFSNTDTTPQVSGAPDVINFVAGDVFTFDIDAIATGAGTLTIAVKAFGYNEYEFIVEDSELVYEDLPVEAP